MVAERFEESLAVTDEGIADAERHRQGWAHHCWKPGEARSSSNLVDSTTPRPSSKANWVRRKRIGSRACSTPPASSPLVALPSTAATTPSCTGPRPSRGRWSAKARLATVVTPPGCWRLQAMAAGDAAAAHGWLCALGHEERKSILPFFPVDVTDEAQLVRIAISAGDEELATVTVAAAERRAESNPTLAAIIGTAAHARGLLDGSAEHLEQAVEQFERSSRPLALSSALEDLGARRIAAGEEKKGIEDLERALTIDVEAGAAWDARRVRARLRARGIRRRVVGTSGRPDTGWAAMTDSELAVARLVAQGLTNRDVAERLFVSPHTVNSHLRQIFAKLQINSRVALTRLASDHEHPV